MKLRRAFLLPALLAGALLSTGCMSKVIETGYQENGYAGWNAVDNERLKLRLVENIDSEKPGTEFPEVWKKTVYVTAKDDAPTTRPVVFVVPEVDWLVANVYKDKPEYRERIQFTARERLYRYLLRAYPDPTRVRYGWRRTDQDVENHRVIVVSANITDVRPGTGWMRYFMGWDAGQARIQLEGEIYDGADMTRKIGEFVVRRGSGGFAQSGSNLKVWKDIYCLQYATEEAVHELTSRLPEFIEGVQVLGSTRSAAEIARH